MKNRCCPNCMRPLKHGLPCPACGCRRPPQVQPHQLPPGTLLAGRYLLGRVLGEGGFGITYIGLDTRLELRVAVKEYYPVLKVRRDTHGGQSVRRFSGVAGQGFEDGRDRFLQEARTMARMDRTPEIVAVRDYFQENNTAYIVMEYVEGVTLKDLVAREGRMPAGRILEWMKPIFRALETMHSLGLIHRDISPDNLMLEGDRVRLLDFGCTREAAALGGQTMTILLKQGYSPVEQYQHKGQGPWTDVYTLAATLYFCLTGVSPPQALDRICEDELVPPRKLGADLTEAQERALLFAMGLQPTHRFRSIRDFYDSLYLGVPVPDRPQLLYGPDYVPPDLPPEPPAPLPAPLPEPRDLAPEERKMEEEPWRLPPVSEETPPPAEAKKRPWLLLAAAAGLLLAAGGWLLLRPWAPMQDPPQTTGSAPPPTDTARDRTVTAGDAQALLDALADPAIDAVRVPENTILTLPAVTVEKPLTLGPGASLTAEALTVAPNGLVTLEAGSFLEAEGSSAIRGTLRGGAEAEMIFHTDLTVDGGTVEAEGGLTVESLLQVASGGHVRAGQINAFHYLLESPSDLAGNTNAGEENTFFLDLSALGSAQTVSTVDELLAAASGDAPAIAVAGPIQDLPYIELEKPVLILPGGSIQSENAMRFSTLVNRGRLEGLVYAEVLYNEREAQISIYRPDRAFCLVNRGELTLLDGICDGLVLNLGQVDQKAAPVFHMAHGTLDNRGSWVVESGATLCLEQAVCIQNGDLTIQSGAEWTNHGAISGNGVLHLEGCLTNNALVMLEGDLLLGPEGRIYGEGMIQAAAGRTDLAEEPRIVGQRILLDPVLTEEAQIISTPEELLAFNGGGEAELLRIPQGVHVTLNEPLTLRVPLLIQGSLELTSGTGLTVDGTALRVEGSLTVGELTLQNADCAIPGDLIFPDRGRLTAQDSRVSLTGRHKDLNGAELTFRGNACLALVANAENAGLLQVQDAAYAMTRDLGSAFGASVSVMDDGLLINAGYLGMSEGKNLTIYNARMCQYGGTFLEPGGRVFIFGGGFLETTDGDFILREGATLTLDDGGLSISGWDFQSRWFNGKVRNQDAIYLTGVAEVHGTFENVGVLYLSAGTELRVYGRLDNQGQVLLSDLSACLIQAPGGAVTGAPPEPEEGAG